MLTKLAGLVLVGSLGALTVGGLLGVPEHHENWRGHRGRHRIERRIEHRIERRIERAHERAERSSRDIGSAHGTYVFDTKGDVLGKFPWAAHVELDLREGGRYELRVKTSVDGNVETETSWGRYSWDDDRVKLYSPGDDEVHELLIEGDQLQWSTGLKEKLALKAVGISEAAFRKQAQ